MKKTITYSLAFLFLTSSFFISCNSIKNSSNTQKEAVLRNSKKSELGAILDVVIGGVTGDIIGRKMDKQVRAIKEALPNAKVERLGEGILLTLGENLAKFNTNMFNLRSTTQASLNKIIPVFKSYKNTNIVIYGYTDGTGILEHKRALSAKRAGAIKKYLTSQGIMSTRIKTKGLGIKDPVFSNQTEEGRSKNRRVEFAILANEKMMKEAEKEAGQ